MHRLSISALACFVFAVTTFASEPGSPLDCTDWVFTEPGLSCVPWVPYPCVLGQGACRQVDTSTDLDAESRQYRLERRSLPAGPCNISLTQLAIVRYDGAIETDIAHIDERCGGPNTKDYIRDTGTIRFDRMSGRLLIPLESVCGETLGLQCTYSQADGGWVAAIEGFATTFEILQTFDPPVEALSFRVPYMPEGLDGADWFDTYYGTLASVGDWSQAQGLECGYPVSPPSVGEYLKVTDTLPEPNPGQGYYYVTAVTFAGETRYGRERSTAGLHGRSPSLLPACD